MSDWPRTPDNERGWRTDKQPATMINPNQEAAEANDRTIWCEEGKHGECKGWGETIFQVPRRRVECRCSCHALEAPHE